MIQVAVIIVEDAPVPIRRDFDRVGHPYDHGVTTTARRRRCAGTAATHARDRWGSGTHGSIRCSVGTAIKGKTQQWSRQLLTAHRCQARAGFLEAAAEDGSIHRQSCCLSAQSHHFSCARELSERRSKECLSVAMPISRIERARGLRSGLAWAA